MRFKYYNILWVILGIMAIIFLFMPKKENDSLDEKTLKKRIPQSEKNGPILSYSENGTLKTKVNYINGVKNGSSYLFYKDGETIQLEIPYVDGKREGVSKKYYENGKIYAETSYKNDLLHGIRKLYYTNGQLKSEINYGHNHPGINLKEYLIDGDIKTKNNITFTQQNSVVNLSTTYPCRDSKFYIGKLIDNQYFDPIDSNIHLLLNNGTQFFIDLNTLSLSNLKHQDIICACKTRQGNPLILKQKIDVSSLKNVNQ